MLPNVAQIVRNTVRATMRQVAFAVPWEIDSSCALLILDFGLVKFRFGKGKCESLNFMTSGFEHESWVWAQEHTNPLQIRGGKSLEPVTGVVVLSLKQSPSANFPDESKSLNFRADELRLRFQNSTNV